MCVFMLFKYCGIICDCCYSLFFFFFKQKTAYEMRISDWSSDVCSSDLCAFHALSDQPTRLVAFSDDMDGLRKVPDNVPNKEMLSQHLGKPLTDRKSVV